MFPPSDDRSSIFFVKGKKIKFSGLFCNQFLYVVWLPHPIVNRKVKLFFLLFIVVRVVVLLAKTIF